MFTNSKYIELEASIRSAGKLAMEFWTGGSPTRPLNPQQKKDGSYVTDGDLSVNAHLVTTIQRLFPDDAIVSEELPRASDEGGRDYAWIIDPIDGTHSFMKGSPNFAILVSRLYRGNVVLGFTCFPVDDKIIVAESGKGAFLEGKPLRMSRSQTIREGHVAAWNFTPTPESLLVASRPDPNRALELLIGGELDLIIERISTQGIWDVTARVIIIREAGGTVTTESGNPVIFAHNAIPGSFIVSSNGFVHDEALRLVSVSGAE